MRNEALIEFCASCYNSPLRYVKAAFNWKEGEGPDLWQEELMKQVESLLTKGEGLGTALRIAVASGHGVGKSALVAWLILWAMSTRPQLAGVVTANTANQLAGKTWRELSIWHKRSVNKAWFKWTSTKFYQKDNPEDWFVSAIAWSKEKPEAFAGLHARHVLMIFDEASAIDAAIYETAEGAMTTPGAMWFCFGNPTRNTGRFFEIHHRLKHRWHCHKVDARHAKMTNKDEISGWMMDYGEDSDFARVRVKGEFPRAGANQLISLELIDAAVRREAGEDISAPRIIGVDVARFGDDQSVIAKRQGRALHPLIKKRGLDTMTLAGLVAQEMDEWDADMCFVDQGGVGAGVVDRLRQLGYRNVIGVDFGGSATDKGRYFNKRSEMWALLREWLKTGAIPEDKDLQVDLAAPEYGFSGDRGQVQLEKKEDMKKRGLASPDAGDAVALTFAQPVAARIVTKGKKSCVRNNLDVF